MSMPSDEARPDLNDMKQQTEKLLAALRNAMSETPAGLEQELAGMLLLQLTGAAADFFPAAEGMYRELDQPQPAPEKVARTPADEQPDELGKRLRQELVDRYPPRAPTKAKPKPKSISEDSLWKSSDESLWKDSQQ